MSPKSEREDALSALTSRIFSTMLGDLVLDVTLQSHHEVARGRALCPVCNTRCGSVHVPEASSQSQTNPSSSRAETPSSGGGDTKPSANGTGGTGASTPTSVKADGNLYLQCVSCTRQIASNRYAPHLSQCMGLGTARRSAVRGLIKSKSVVEATRSASPASDAGNVSDERPSAKGKGKSKTKRADDSGYTLKRKRASPQVSPSKRPKKQTKPLGSPVSRVKAEIDAPVKPNPAHYSPNLNSQSKVPSKLRDSSTASFLDRSPTTSSSRSSTPAGASAAPTPPSSFTGHSPSLPARGVGNGRGRGRAKGIGPPPKRPSPPRPPPPIHVPDFSIDVEGGDETGSSTDTDSS